MSRLKCITDDLEEEISLRIKDGYLTIFPPDLDLKAMGQELGYMGDLSKAALALEASTKMVKLVADYAALVVTVSSLCDLDLKAAEARIAKREVPEILKKMEE